MASVNVIWDPVTMSVDSAPIEVDSYSVYVDGEADPCATVDAPSTSVTLDLAVGAHEIRVSATEDGVEGAQSLPASITVPNLTPAAPVNVSATLA